MMKVLKGETPRLEEERNLRKRRIVHRAYEGQNSIGWDNLTLGRPSKGTVRLQEWWDGQNKDQRQGQDSSEVIRQVMEVVVVTTYEMWKQQSSKVIEKEGPKK